MCPWGTSPREPPKDVVSPIAAHASSVFCPTCQAQGSVRFDFEAGIKFGSLIKRGVKEIGDSHFVSDRHRLELKALTQIPLP